MPNIVYVVWLVFIALYFFRRSGNRCTEETPRAVARCSLVHSELATTAMSDFLKRIRVLCCPCLLEELQIASVGGHLIRASQRRSFHETDWPAGAKARNHC